MADNIEKKVLVDIGAANDGVKSALSQLGEDLKSSAEQLKNLRAAIAAAKAATAEANTEYAKERANTQAARTEYQKKRTAILEANQALKASKQATEAAAGSYAEAQKRLTALGKAIKSAEGGFKSSTPEIKKQIAEYNKLNSQLKAFDAKMGNHQRNVGNYKSVLSGLNNALGSLSPGFSQLTSVLTTATQSFSAMSGSTAEAGTSVTSLGGSILGTVAAIVVAITAIGAYASAIANLTPHAEAIQRTFSGINAVWRQMVADMHDGFFDEKLTDNFDTFKKKWMDFFMSLKDAFIEGSDLKQQFQDLARSANILQVSTAEADTKIADLQLKMRDRRITPAQEKKYFDEIQAISEESYQQRKEVADKEYELAIRAATLGRNFTQEEIAQLKEKGVAYAEYLDKIKGLANKAGAGTDVAAIRQAQIDQDAAKRFKLTTEDRASNRLNAKLMKGEEEARKQEEEMISAEAAYKKAQEDKLDITLRTMSLTQEAFGKELSATQEHYRQLIFAQEKFIDEQRKLRAKTKSQRVKDQADRNIKLAQGNIGLIGTERDTDIAEKVQNQAELMFELLQKSSDELTKAQISNILDVEQRQLADLNLKRNMQIQALHDETADRDKAIERLTAQMEKASGIEKDILQTKIADLKKIQDNANKKDLEDQKSYKNQKYLIKKAAADKELAAKDQAALTKARREDKNDTSEHAKALHDAEVKQENDQYEAAIKTEGLTKAKKESMYQEHVSRLSEIDDAYYQKKLAKAMKWEKLIQDSAFSILQNALASQFEAEQVNLSKQKAWELNNTALTSTQKYQVEEKYRIEEGKAKVKQFKQEQALKIAEATMEGAKAVVGDLLTPEKIPFDIATTVAEIAVIAAQKAPAYAVGGIHVGNGPVIGPGTGTSDSINARLSNGESVINARSTSMFAPLLSAINQLGGGVPFDRSGGFAFASGGVFNTYLPTSDNGLRPQLPVSARIHVDDMMTLGTMFSDAVAGMPAPIVDVKDVSNQQQRLSSVSDIARF